MSRFHAASIHFLISLAIFTVLAYLVLFEWYPDIFFSIDGGWEGIRIIVLVDLVLGPLLTLIVFKAGKPGLKFDLTAIALFQAIALTGGTWVVYSERPLFFIYYDDHFYSASADAYTEFGVDTPDPDKFSKDLPARVVTVMPEDPIEVADLRVDLFKKKLPPWTQERLYEPMDQYLDKIVDSGFDEQALRERDEEGLVDAFLEEHGGSFNDYAFIPTHCRYLDGFIGVRRSDAKLVGFIEVPPPLV